MDGMLNKQPAEKFSVTIDYNARLQVSETVSSVAVASIRTDTGATVTVTGTTSIADGIVTVPVTGGTDGVDYRIRVRATTSSSNVHEADILMRVREEG